MHNITKILKTTAIKSLLLFGAIIFTSILTSCGGSETSDNPSAENGKTSEDVKIGTQTWTTKNLDVSNYRNGDAIPQVQDAKQWENLKTGAWCYYDNKPSNGEKYGKLYNWYAVSDARGLAPAGYHIPTDNEWRQLFDFLGGEDDAGSKMKSISGWKDNRNGNNESGFLGLPGGARTFGGYGTKFVRIDEWGVWWTSTIHSCGRLAFFCGLSYDGGGAHKNDSDFWYGRSVRCIKD